MQKEISEIKDSVESQGRIIDKIYISIAGDPVLGTKGIVHKLGEHDKRLEGLEKYQAKDKKFKWSAIGAVGGAGIAGGAVASPGIKAFFAFLGKLFSVILTSMLVLTFFMVIYFLY